MLPQKWDQYYIDGVLSELIETMFHLITFVYLASLYVYASMI